jgi:ferric-dicitrate binding protein FerR (iron transport regulator)
MKEDQTFKPDPADQQAFRVAYLVAGFIRNTLTDAENRELDDWVTASMDNQRLFERLIDEKNQDEWIKQMGGVDTASALKRVKARISFGPSQKKSGIRSLWPYAAAACVLIALAITFFIKTPNKTNPNPPMVQLQPNDIAPGKDQATLTLSDGTVIGLDTVQNGRVVAQSNSHITKLDSGQLAYQLVNPTMLPQADIFNTLTVPAGGQYKLVLPDGTKVWLNAASSLKYPTVFGGAKRKVELTGEGYFEVAKDPMYPFEVSAKGSTVQVLGTHFNINAYTDEPVVRVALAEGAIRLNNAVLLRPGEEGIVGKNGNIEKGKADLATTLAWKEGQFNFKQAPIDVLMRQVARWYNAGIIYDGKITEHFNAEIPRNVPVSKLLHLLEATGSVHFKIENNTITVMK